MSKKLGLALGSGGACGIAHIGFLKALQDNGIAFDLIAGSSMGGIVGGVLGAGVALADMEQEAMKLSMLAIMDFDPTFYRSRGFLRGKKVEAILRRLVGEKRIEELAFPFACTAVDMATSELVTLDCGELVPALQATSAIAGVFRPVQIEGRMLIDGGTIERVPCKLCRDMGADVVVGVDVLGELRPSAPPRNIIEFITRTFNIMDWQITKAKTCEADLMINVEQEDVDQIHAKNLDKGIAAGYAAAISHLEEIRELVNS